MPNSGTHKAVGACTGLISLLALPPLSPGRGSATVAGRIAGGFVGGLLPDRLEPATSPRHRSTCHSMLAEGTLAMCVNAARGFEKLMCEKSMALRLAASGQRDALLRLLINIGAWITEFFGSSVVGLVVGYISHLVADLCTPAGIPIV